MIKIDLNQKVALVTGGSRGIGKSIVQVLAKSNAKVVYTASSSESLKSAVEKFSDLNMDVKGYVANQSVAKEVKSLVSQVKEDMGRIDFLINNAGITKDNLILRMSDEQWQTVIDTNLNGVFYTTKEVVKIMTKQRYGRVVSLSSVVGFSGNPGQSNYAATKGALVAFSKSLASELASRGINFNVVAPGFIETDMTDAIPENIKDTLKEKIPLKKVGYPEDIAYAVAFLCSDMANYITGSTLHVNGGIY